MNTPSRIVRLTQKPAPDALSKGQKLFKQLVRKIDRQRKHLQAWLAVIPRYQQKSVEEFEPLLAAYDDLRERLVLLFDRAYDDKRYTKREREKLADLIVNIAGETLEHGDRPALKAVFNKYQDEDYDSQTEEAGEIVKDMLETMFGVDIEGKLDPNDPEALLKALAQQAQTQAAQGGRKQAAKQSAKQAARQARQEEEEKNISLSIREVYRKLASSLHPDRERDPDERARKTDLMQQVNAAYDRRDLLRLLELQLEIEQIDEAGINNIGETRLKHYNQVLREQVKELDMEIEGNVLAFSLRFRREVDVKTDPEAVFLALGAEVEALKAAIDEITEDLALFEDPKVVKAFLKTYRIQPQASFDGWMDDLDF